MLLRSPLLSDIPQLVHGFTTRLGGVSDGPGASWDLTLTDASAPGEENLRRLGLRLGFDRPVPVIQVEQIHGTQVIDARDVHGRVEADGLIVDRPDTVVAVRTADCAPILIAALDARGRPQAVAAVHAGWRGATAGIVREAVAALSLRGAAPSRMYAAVGPTIGLEAFEVGPEVVDAARAALGGAAPRLQEGPRGRPHLDLPDLVQRLLVQAGLPSSQVDRVGGCTASNPAMFFSHRRDRGVTGRHAAAIAIQGALD